MTEPILLDFPDSITTERLILRSPRPGDGKAVFQAVKESQEHLKNWMPWAVDIPDEEGYEKWARENYLEFIGRVNLSMLMILKESGKIIGGSGYHTLNWEIPSCEIGYWIHPAYSGRGYMTEAVSTLTDFAFENFEAARVEIRCDAANQRSAAVAKRAGYALEATFHNHRRHHLTNELTTTLVYAKTANRSEQIKRGNLKWKNRQR
ncbi:MAG: GNAT family N-acetyltransferase [Chloroflexota bacterium]